MIYARLLILFLMIAPMSNRVGAGLAKREY